MRGCLRGFPRGRRLGRPQAFMNPVAQFISPVPTFACRHKGLVRMYAGFPRRRLTPHRLRCRLVRPCLTYLGAFAPCRTVEPERLVGTRGGFEMVRMNSINYREKIIALWTVFLLGTLFHTQLALIPLFHGIDVAMMSHHHQETATIAEIQPILWGMLLFFVLPMIAIVSTAFYNFRRYRVFHFGLTLVYTILNFLHLFADLLVEPIAWYQIVLMMLLFSIGILLNLVSYQWLKRDTFSSISAPLRE